MAGPVTSVVTTRENVTKKSLKMALIAAQDIKLAKILAGNNKKLRDRALKRLRKWLRLRSESMPFTEIDFMRIWKGLFYSMWMSDKLLVQEECAESIANLVHFNTADNALLFLRCGLQTLCNEWFGIDQLRLDKFLMFVRRLLRQGLVVLKNNSWNVKDVKAFNDVLSATILNVDAPPPGGLMMHFIEIYLEEVAKVSEGNLKQHLLTEMLRPFVQHLAVSTDARVTNCIKRHIFDYLIKQSDAGVENVEKFKAWKQEGFPGGSIDSMQLTFEDDDDDVDASEETPALDPRAGHTDVVLPQLKFSSKQIVELLTRNKFLDGSNTKSRKTITTLLDEFTELSKGKYPLGVKKVDLPRRDRNSMKTKNAVNRLVKFEQKILGKTKKRRKLDDKRPKVDLEAFIKKSEAHLSKKNGGLSEISGKTSPKTESRNGVDDSTGNYQCSFRRNSGTWFVYSEDDSSFTSPVKVSDEPKVNGNAFTVNESTPELDSSSKSSPKKRKRITPIRVVDSVDVFEQSPWDIPLKNGEVEIFVPSRKSVRRNSLNESLVKNPFSATKKSPGGGSSKKVKIDLKLNRSQEIHEHVAQIKNSPGIPFDANRKPTKPLLKSTNIRSPINPFYKKKLKL